MHITFVHYFQIIPCPFGPAFSYNNQYTELRVDFCCIYLFPWMFPCSFWIFFKRKGGNCNSVICRCKSEITSTIYMHRRNCDFVFVACFIMKINPYKQNHSHGSEEWGEGVMSCDETTTKADKLTHVKLNWTNGANVFCFLSSLPPYPPSHNGLWPRQCLDTICHLSTLNEHCIAGAGSPNHM